jgi:hypothetical protein
MNAIPPPLFADAYARQYNFTRTAPMSAKELAVAPKANRLCGTAYQLKRPL